LLLLKDSSNQGVVDREYWNGWKEKQSVRWTFSFYLVSSCFHPNDWGGLDIEISQLRIRCPFLYDLEEGKHDIF